MRGIGSQRASLVVPGFQGKAIAQAFVGYSCNDQARGPAPEPSLSAMGTFSGQLESRT